VSKVLRRPVAPIRFTGKNMSTKRFPAGPFLICAIAVILTGCASSTYEWGWFEIMPTTDQGAGNLKFLAGGVWLTLALSLTSIFFSILIGLFIALTGISEVSWLRWANLTYVEIFRSIPLHESVQRRCCRPGP
jgi:ABC-type amino acid transport system permease subunit